MFFYMTIKLYETKGKSIQIRIIIVIFNVQDKVDRLKTFFWLAVIILIIFFMDNYLVHLIVSFENNQKIIFVKIEICGKNV